MEQYKNKNGKYPRSLEELFSNKMINDTIKYQKKYGFDIGENNSTWNNEADAFKHTYMQATLDLRSNEQIAKKLGDRHEYQGNDRGQPSGESNMDLWNNQQGREVAKEIYKQYGVGAKISPPWPLNDIIADKVMQRMRAGKLITNPSDTRKFVEKGQSTGYAAPVANNGQVFTPEQIGNMSREEFDKNESAIMSQMKDGLIQTQSPSTNFSGFTNPVSGSKQIFSREDIGAMSTDEFSNNEKAINAQLNSIGVPTSNELHNATNGGGAVYIEPYIRSDGVQVKGYYRAR